MTAMDIGPGEDAQELHGDDDAGGGDGKSAVARWPRPGHGNNREQQAEQRGKHEEDDRAEHEAGQQVGAGRSRLAHARLPSHHRALSRPVEVGRNLHHADSLRLRLKARGDLPAELADDVVRKARPAFREGIYGPLTLPLLPDRDALLRDLADALLEEVRVHNRRNEPTRLILPVGPVSPYRRVVEVSNREQLSW